VRYRLLVRITTALLITVCAPTVYGQSTRTNGTGGGTTAQQVIAQMQQVASERAAAQADAAKAKQDLSTAQDQLKKLQAELDALKSRSADADQLARVQREAQQATADLERSRSSVSELTRQLREATTQLRDVESARSALNATLSAEVRTHETCVRDNAELSSLALDTLTRYEKRAGSGEPFFKISRTRAQNLVDEYRAKVTDLKAPKPVPDAASTAH
jgi:chromosome segregation ATPase